MRIANPVGRQYVRKNVYVDVLGIPTITEAVRTASEMLRRGIIHAMSTSPEDEAASSSKQPRTERQKSASQHSQGATSAADRDPVSVYTDAIAKRPRKPPASDVSETGNDPSDSPVIIVKEKMAGDKAPTTSRAWNSTKIAGPSILSKRSRPQSSTAGGSSGSERVFQPALKREKRDELAKKQALLHAAAKVSKTAREKERANELSSTKAPAPAQNSTSKLVSEMKSAPSTGREKLMSSASSQEKKQTKTTGAAAQVRTVSKDDAPTEKAKVQSSKPTPMILQSQRQLKPISSLRSPSARKLPAAWSQVSSNGFKVAAQPKTSVLRKAGSGSVLAKGAGSSTSTARGEVRGNFTLQQLNMLRNRSEGLPPVRPPPTQSKSGSDAMIPLPSTSGLHVKYVPGSEIIKGVRPNGYTVSREGVVKPVVTFSPKPKLPHKLRQTSCEKIFELLRGVKKLAEGEALSEALRTEQVMYADAPGRVEYRAAVTTMLKDIRN